MNDARYSQLCFDTAAKIRSVLRAENKTIKQLSMDMKCEVSDILELLSELDKADKEINLYKIQAVFLALKYEYRFTYDEAVA